MTTSSPTGQAETQREALPADNVLALISTYASAIHEAGFCASREERAEIERLRQRVEAHVRALATAAPASKPPVAVSDERIEELWLQWCKSAPVQTIVGFARLVLAESGAPATHEKVDCTRGDGHTYAAVSERAWAATHEARAGGRDQERAVASRAVQDVLTERRRQVEVEGWTAEHDEEHADGDMARAAACYAWPDIFHHLWPWSPEWWKPKDTRRNLVRAGALILAEIERLDRDSQASNRDSTVPGSTPAGAEVQGL